MEDKYFKLKQIPLTPDDEICYCKDIKEIYLAYKLGDNPVHCCECNGEIEPDRLQYPEKIVDEIASWCSVYSALYNLWLNSGEYEKYAKEKLEDINGQVNVQGLELSKNLLSIRPCYYLWFDENDIESEIKENCPICGKPFTEELLHFNKCQNCKILL